MNGKRTAFPPGFLWGAATAAFQIEGSTDVDGRGESIWDRFCATPGKVANGDDGRVACDHYRRWPQDLDLARHLNLNAYRFSIAWPRIQPTPDGKVNPKGLEFYDKLVDGMLARGLAPFMTLYHWDLPQYLQDKGGWANRETVDRFVDYSRIVAGKLGDRVKGIVTFNEPFVSAFLGHWTGAHAPGTQDPQVSVNVSLHQLLAHGRAVQALRADGVKAPLGIVNVMGPVHAATSSDADRREADRFDLLFNRLYLEPLFNARLPERTHELLGVTPAVRDGDLATISTPIDFLGMNYYFRRIADAAAGPPPGRSQGGPAPGDTKWPLQDRGGSERSERGGTSPEPRLPPGAVVTEMGWEVYHEGLTEHLVDMKRRYANLPPVYITESGCACDDRVVDGRVDDHFRVAYVQGQIAALGRAIAAGVDVRGYFAWSLMDNFEWAHGYAKRFGLVHVDYATQQRTVKASGQWYRDFVVRGG
jgi:beta-glucosidase